MVGSGPDPAKYSAPDRPGSASLWKRKGVFFSFSIKGGQINLDFEALGCFPFVGFLFQKLSGLFLLMLSEIGYLPVPPVSVSTLNIILWRFRVIKTSPIDIRFFTIFHCPTILCERLKNFPCYRYGTRYILWVLVGTYYSGSWFLILI